MTKTPNIDEANKLLAQASPGLIRLKMPTGNSDFRDILNKKCVYVDKTLLVKEIVDSGEKVILITRPRRWGKTLGMSMLKYFFALEVDNQGKEVEQNSSKTLFDNLKIASTDTINEQGKYPVIFLTLKDIKGASYEELEDQLRRKMSSVFQEYTYIYNAMIESNDKTKQGDIEQFDRMLNRTSSKGDITSSIQLLSKLLKAYHNKSPILLLDEYDVPLNNSYNTDFYQEVLLFIRSLFESGIKDNYDLEKAVVTGVFKIAKSGLWTGMNNSKDYSILSEKYAEYFGFTEAEVEELLSEARIKDPSIKSAVREWYNGYNIGGHIVYNPWSIINFFSDLKISLYWVNTESMVAGDRRLSTDLMITEQIHDKVNLLIANFGKELTEITINPEVIFSTLNQEESSLLGLLLFGGYLSTEIASYDEIGRLMCQAKIPNREVLSIYNSSIYLWVREKLSIDQKTFDSLGQDFNLEDIKTVKGTIDKALSVYGDRIAEKNESVFHSLIQSICLLKGDKHRLASESYSGFGRVDSIFYPVEKKSDTVIIHEYKIIKDLKSEDQLKSKLCEAIWQIYEKIYTDMPIIRNKYFAEQSRNIELRAIVILASRTRDYTEILTRNHTVREMLEIASWFRSYPKDKARIAELKDKLEAEVDEYIRQYI